METMEWMVHMTPRQNGPEEFDRGGPRSTAFGI